MLHHFSLPSLGATLTLGLSLSTLSAAAPHNPLRRESNEGARNIYVAGYDGLVRTLHYDGTTGLTLAHTSPGCETNPTWLTLQPSLNRLWCLDEGWTAGHGTLNLFSTSPTGALTHQLRHPVSAGPVSTEFYGPASAPSLAIAQYGGPDDGTVRGGLTLHAISHADGAIANSYNHTFPALSSPGPRPAQRVPRGHHVVRDPTGRFLAVPDLGADKLRLFAIDAASGDVAELSDLQLPIGSGLRHARFAAVGKDTYLYLVSEFANTVTVFAVAYGGGKGLALTKISEVSTFGPDADPEVVARSQAAEIQISPDGRFVVVSNRGDDSFGEGEDSLATFEILKGDGKEGKKGELVFVQLVAAGGSRPRYFEISKDGKRVVVAAQASERVVVLEREVKSGLIKGELAGLKVETGGWGTPAAIWG